MSLRVLILISEDPAVTGRPAEAVRLAAGLAGCGQVSVEVYLHGPAVKMLAPETFDAIDMDVLLQNWHLAANESSPAWVQAGMLQLHRVVDPVAPCREITPAELLKRFRDCDIAIRFDAKATSRVFDWHLMNEFSDPNLKIERPLVLSDAQPGSCPPVVFDLAKPSLDYQRLLLEVFRMERSATL